LRRDWGIRQTLSALGRFRFTVAIFFLTAMELFEKCLILPLVSSLVN
jgi:hypothetical protein